MKSEDALGLINKSIRSLQAYHLEPLDLPVKLNQNENPYDWPEPVKKEIAEFCMNRPWNRYPPFIPEKLKEMVAQYTGVSSEGIIIGNGSNEMILVLMLSVMNRSAKVIISQPTFTVYKLLSDGLGGETLCVSMKDDLSFDVDSLKKACRDKPGSVLILCSPNNPTGGSLSREEIEEILDVHTGFFILDQAYVEFGGFNAIPLISRYPNLIITRTFSKAFAAAGLRLGYMIGSPEIIAEINKIKLPYNVNFFSEHVASVLIRNRPLLDNTIKEIISERESLLQVLRSLPFDNVYPSESNFILVRTETKQALFDFLKSKGILIRDVSKYPMLQNCLRISIGKPEENALLKDALREYFSSR
ncbi:MAG TPA: histidinol-phosphate transaminase [Chitinispirillaceae bacterium]|nr:histidinol-phosphate transaminase [Chitinispirillaceae bacterium]